MKNIIPAIFEEDIQKFLTDYKELKPIQNGERFCRICGVIISINNIQYIIPQLSEKKFTYVCNSISCVEKFQESQQ